MFENGTMPFSSFAVFKSFCFRDNLSEFVTRFQFRMFLAIGMLVAKFGP